MITKVNLNSHPESYMLLALFIVLISISCSRNNDIADAYGNFEAREVTVSSQVQGELLSLTIQEGQHYDEGELVAVIDTIPFYLKRLQLIAQKSVIRAKSNNILAQIKVHEEEKKNILTEKKRLENLVKDNAATQKQLDDINGKLNVLQLTVESVKQQNRIVMAEMEVLESELKQIDNQISKCKIINPVSGTVIEKFIEQNEIVTPAHPIYKITNLSEMELKVYIDGSQLAEIKVGDTVTVAIDKGKKAIQKTNGIVSWISSEVEFTPKTIQTKEERVNMVYAMKIRVANDGRIKIGMPGEVYFRK
jgi:HlyD family secretion protein